MFTHSVPFGKYKDQPVSHLLADQPYLDWIAAQPDIIDYLKSNYPELFTLVSRRTDQDSVQHNRLQAKFLDRNFLRAFHQALGSKLPREDSRPEYQEHWYMDFECGYDVRLWTDYDASPQNSTPRQQWKIEIKPSLGDDYPAVLRQMKHHKANVLLIEYFSSAACSIQQVKNIFRYSGIQIRFFSDIEELQKSEISDVQSDADLVQSSPITT